MRRLACILDRDVGGVKIEDGIVVADADVEASMVGRFSRSVLRLLAAQFGHN